MNRNIFKQTRINQIIKVNSHFNKKSNKKDYMKRLIKK